MLKKLLIWNCWAPNMSKLCMTIRLQANCVQINWTHCHKTSANAIHMYIYTIKFGIFLYQKKKTLRPEPLLLASLLRYVCVQKNDLSFSVLFFWAVWDQIIKLLADFLLLLICEIILPPSYHLQKGFVRRSPMMICSCGSVKMTGHTVQYVHSMYM